MKFLAGLVAAASLAAAAPAGEKKAPTPVDVKFEMAGNSAVKATISNHGKSNLKLFKVGTIFDDSAIEKATVMSGEEAVEFKGMRKRITTKNIAPDAFQHIPAGESIEVTFDVAHVHDLSPGGKYNIHTEGVWSFADENGNELIGSIPFESNKLEVDVNGAEAAAVHTAYHDNWKRTRVQSDCSGSKGSATTAALSNCAKLARAAQQAASSGPADRMQEYFKGSDSTTRNKAAAILGRVVSECGSTNGGISDYYCTDVGGDCGSNVLAYTVPSQSYQAYCDIYFNNLPGLTSSCHRQDQATTTLHEMTHLSQVGGTRDLGYGYTNAMRLSNSQALNNADTYALFANAVYVNC